jgi:hypothetical protein
MLWLIQPVSAVHVCTKFGCSAQAARMTFFVNFFLLPIIICGNLDCTDISDAMKAQYVTLPRRIDKDAFSV